MRQDNPVPQDVYQLLSFKSVAICDTEHQVKHYSAVLNVQQTTFHTHFLPLFTVTLKPVK